jgi:hypothetical protein
MRYAIGLDRSPRRVSRLSIQLVDEDEDEDVLVPDPAMSLELPMIVITRLT